MSKKIVLKSVIAIAMLGFVLVFSSCKKEKDEESKKEEPKKEEPKKEEVHEIVGVWEYEKVELKELTCSNPSLESLIKIALQQPEVVESFIEEFKGIYEFTKDGKIIAGDDIGNYEIQGNKLIITESSISGTFDFSIAGKKMYWNTALDAQSLEYLSAFLSELLGEYSPTPIDVQITKFGFQITFIKVE